MVGVSNYLNVQVYMNNRLDNLALHMYSVLVKLNIVSCCKELPAASNDSLLEVRRRIEETSLGLRQRRARLYSQTGTEFVKDIKCFKCFQNVFFARDYLPFHVLQCVFCDVSQTATPDAA